MKKLLGLGLLGALAVGMTACSKKSDLHILNWGDYMDEDLVAAFEDAKGVKVALEFTTSNENMYAEFDKFDLAIPSEYMISKMKQEGKLETLDLAKLSNYKKTDLDPIVSKLLTDSSIDDVTVPYAIGVVGIMYKTTEKVMAKIEDLDETYDIYDLFFDATSGLNRGIYDNSRDAMGAALVNLGYKINSTNTDELAEAAKLIKDAEFNKRGADDLKRAVADPANPLEMALVYSGDFFEQYFTYEDAELEIKFDFETIKTTNVFLDGMVVRKGGNTDLAYDFINFMLEAEHNVKNIDYVGYCTPFTSVYQTLVTPDYGYGELPWYHPGYPEGYPTRITENLYQMYTYSKAHEQALDTYYLKSK